MKERTIGIAVREVKALIRWLRAACVAAALFVPLGAGFTAMAQSCPALDPTCTVNDTVGTAGQTAGDAVNKSKGGIDDAASTVRGTVDGVVPGGGSLPPGGGGGGGSDPGGGGGRPGSGHHPAGNGGRQSGLQPTTSAGAGSPTSAPDPGSSSTTPRDSVPDPKESSRPTFTAVAAGVLGGAAVMAFLVGAIAVFLMVQDRLDRRDPKLLPVSIGSDRVQFT